MVGIKVQPDTTYGLGTVAVRFTVENGVPVHLIPVLAVPYIKKAIDHFERLGDGYGHKYRFRDDIPIRFEYSRLQGDPYDIHIKDVISYEQRLFGQGLVDCVAILTFEQPLLYVHEDPAEQLTTKDGFLDFDRLPQGLIEAMEKEEEPIEVKEDTGLDV